MGNKKIPNQIDKYNVVSKVVENLTDLTKDPLIQKRREEALAFAKKSGLIKNKAVSK